MRAKINGAKSMRELEAVAGDMRGLPEEVRAELRGPYRAARENLLRIAAAPAQTENTTRKPVWGDPDYEEVRAPREPDPIPDRVVGEDDDE
jgi:hypothetical protein